MNRDKVIAFAIVVGLGLAVAVLLYASLQNIGLAGIVIIAAVVIAAFLDRRR